MNISKSTIKNTLLLHILPIASLFSFLFYVFWTYPVQILSQELPINEYFLFNNPYLQTSLLVCIVLFILLILTSNFLPKVFPYILGSVLVCLIWTFLYKYTIAYSYGGFVDNLSLTPEKPLLGYSFWYFALDFIFPIFSIIITIFALKKNFYKPILLLFFIFYSIENGSILFKVRLTPTKNINSTSLPLSTNHKNLIFFMLDSVGTPVILDMINNQWTGEQKTWTKDFTFYDNVVSLSSGGTLPSLPTMFGGYDFSPAYQINDWKTNEIDFFKIPPENIHFFDKNLPTYIHTDKALESINNKIKNVANIHYASIQDKHFSDSKSINSSPISYINIPIIVASIYQFLPYLFRNILASDRNPTTSFGWSKDKRIPPIKWIGTRENLQLEFKETPKGYFYIFMNDGLHSPFDSPDSPITSSQAKTTADYGTLFYHKFIYNTTNIPIIIDILKNNNTYNNTRIIITSDHGPTSFLDPIVHDYYTEISTSKISDFYDLNLTKKILNPHYIPVFIMDKPFNSKQDTLQLDSRFLSLGDLQGTIVKTFVPDSIEVDFLDTIPPQRLFNIPSMDWTMLYYIGGNTTTERYKKAYKYLQEKLITNNNLAIIKVKDIKNGEFIISNYNYDNIKDLPAFEILK